MAIIAKEEGGNYTPVPEGVHRAVCFGIVDLGMQYSEKFDKTTHKVMIMWEFPDEKIETDEGEKPCVISKEYSLSLHEKAVLRKDLEAWRGKMFTAEELAGFDILNLLGVGCQIQINHAEKNGKTYANIAGIMALPKKMKVEDSERGNENLIFDMSDSATYGNYDKLPEWIRTKVDNSETWKEIKGTGTDDYAPLDDDDELPF
jgi:hypothetical protein